jgi:hypothetical protein
MVVSVGHGMINGPVEGDQSANGILHRLFKDNVTRGQNSQQGLRSLKCFQDLDGNAYPALLRCVPGLVCHHLEGELTRM